MSKEKPTPKEVQLAAKANKASGAAETTELTQKQERRYERLVHDLKRGYVYNVLKNQDKLRLPKSLLESEEFTSAAQKGIAEQLKDGSVEAAHRIVDEYSLPDNVVKPAVREGMVYALSVGFFDDYLRTMKEFPLPDDVVKSVAEEALGYALRTRLYENAGDIIDNLPISKEFLKSEVRDALVEALTKTHDGLIDKYFKTAASMPFEELNLSEKEYNELIDSAVQEALVVHLGKGTRDGVNNALRLKKAFPLQTRNAVNSDEVRSAAQDCVENLEKHIFLDAAKAVSEEFNLPEGEK